MSAKKPAILTDQEIQELLKRAPDWEVKENTVTKKFRFKLFKEAVAFFNKVAETAEQLDHHPDILLYNYNRIRVTSTTHLVGGKITERDRNLINAIEKIPRQEHIPK